MVKFLLLRDYKTLRVILFNFHLMNTLNLAGIKISDINKVELLQEIESLIVNKKNAYVVTPYSMFVVKAQKDIEFKNILNQADISTADGIGITLGIKYFSLKGVYLPMLKCLTEMLFNPSYFKGTIKEKLSGSEFIYDVCELAVDQNYKVFMLGGLDFGNGNTGDLAKQKLLLKYPKLEIVGTYAGTPDIKEDQEIVEIINSSNAQILLIAYGPIQQEKWIYRNQFNLKPMVSICLGGTFDYVSGEKKKVSKGLSDKGFEGLLRPLISEKGNIKLMLSRMKKAWLGIIVFIFALIQIKRNTQED